jgi:superfamily II DNA or RNA helicase
MTDRALSYADFLASKQRVFLGAGHEARALPSTLYEWQDAIVRWAVRKGRSAIFADCGLGKSFMQISWASAMDVPTLFLAPLCVAEQTVREAAKLGIVLKYARDSHDAGTSQFVITNYERLDKFDVSRYGAVVLDESSILKSFDGKTRTKLIETFADTPYRLCCTATPSPNDISELANHAEFLGLMTRAEFLATWFIHDDAGWRMKKHAVQPFYRWLASWAVAVSKPSDLGYDDGGFALPPLTISDVVLDCEHAGDALFPELGVKGIQGRLSARRASLEDRVSTVATMTGDRNQWLLWCGLNEESNALARAIPDSVEVQGSDDYAEKVGAVQSFIAGDIRVLVTKAKILGFGMNFQHCHHMAFVGLGDSYETYYQCIRRCWRYGQSKPVDVSIVVSDAERGIVENVRRKERAAQSLSTMLLEHMREFERAEVLA